MLNLPIRLDRNEVPFDPPPHVIAAARDGLSQLNRYAEPEDLARLRALLGDYTGVPDRHIILGPGSDFLLREMIHVFAPERKVVMLSPSFLPTVEVAWERAASWQGLRLSPPSFALRPRLLVAETCEPCLAVIDSPNNPTGQITLTRETVRAVLKNPDVLLVVDAAYHEFAEMSLRDRMSGGGPFVKLVEDYPNLAVTRTLDKAFSLAGARVGYVVAGDIFREAFASFYALLPQPSLHAAIAALQMPAYAWENVDRLIQERERVRETLDDMGVCVYPSVTNFLLIRSELPDAALRLRDRGVLVWDVSNQLPPGFIRVSIGTRDENEVFLDAFSHIGEKGTAATAQTGASR